MVNHENVATEEEVASSEMELVTLDADTATVSEMEEAAFPKGKPDVSQTEGKIVSEVNEASVMVNGTEKSHQTDTNCLVPPLCAFTHTKELSSTEQDHFETSAMKDSGDILVGSVRRSDSQKPPESQPGVSAQSDAMETEPTSLSANISNSVFWDHLYCRPLPGESKNSCPGVTGNPSALTPVEITTEGIIEVIHEFLEQFYEKYGSFTPLIDTDVLDHLNKTFPSDLSDRQLVTAEVAKYKAGLACAPMHFFQVTYNKHTLTLDDLSTLDDQNWVNDQVINMYGELIMEATSHKVHFFNSFFYRQFVAKGYEGVKRWTKKVDLFSKKLILIPLHLEIHWSLIAVDVSKQNINFYDSQGILFKFAVDHVLKYILAEAKEKKQLAFQKGWKMVINKTIPQQKNDNDCGVFVLEYCKCLAFLKPLLFTQEDMPRVRKRIYRELCDRRLSDCSNQDEAT
ncbi:Sentrin-specific protease 5 [Triplophysa tibetana]|uniref:Sentrin-specific protease 5 n=1 Tax=Triplophysa tibetana TaxID=1572043 RepID=A0A5A9NTZ6_9TELE|nr:Sentrin-specific protease 5 [Triplophysa tibetana]